MPEQDQPPAATREELLQLGAELSQHSSELRTDLVLELQELRRDVLAIVRREFTHATELARTESRFARTEQQSQAEVMIDRLGALGSALESRLSTLVIIGQVATALVVIAAMIFLR